MIRDCFYFLLGLALILGVAACCLPGEVSRSFTHFRLPS